MITEARTASTHDGNAQCRRRGILLAHNLFNLGGRNRGNCNHLSWFTPADCPANVGYTEILPHSVNVVLNACNPMCLLSLLHTFRCIKRVESSSGQTGQL